MHNPVLNVTEGDRVEHDGLSLYLRGAYREDKSLHLQLGRVQQAGVESYECECTEQRF